MAAGEMPRARFLYRDIGGAEAEADVDARGTWGTSCRGRFVGGVGA
jgi:hypothetical protein